MTDLVPLEPRTVTREEPIQCLLRYSFRSAKLERAAVGWKAALEYALRAQDTLGVKRSMLSLADLVDDDRVGRTRKQVKRWRLEHVEDLGKLPVPDAPVTVVCPDQRKWRVEPLGMHEEKLWIPVEAMKIIEQEACAGLRFDTALVLHELSPAFKPRGALLDPGASLATRAVRKMLGAVVGIAEAMRPDPALVGCIRSLPEMDTGHYFCLVRWT